MPRRAVSTRLGFLIGRRRVVRLRVIRAITQLLFQRVEHAVHSIEASQDGRVRAHIQSTPEVQQTRMQLQEHFLEYRMHMVAPFQKSVPFLSR